MIIPVRCFSCGKPVGQLWAKFQDMVRAGKPAKEAMTELGLSRYCCRALFLGHIELIDTLAKYKKA